MRWKNWVGATAALWLSAGDLKGQGIFVVDQASGDLTEPITQGSVIPQNDLAQSFTPALSAVGFVQFRSLATLDPPGRTVALVVNLRQGAFNGPVISSTDPVFIVGAQSLETFYFPDNIAVTPGQLYFFQPMLLTPGSLTIGTKSPSGYLRGDLWSNGLMDPQADLWFREGIVVPEPSAVWLLLSGVGALLWLRRVRRKS